LTVGRYLGTYMPSNDVTSLQTDLTRQLHTVSTHIHKYGVIKSAIMAETESHPGFAACVKTMWLQSRALKLHLEQRRETLHADSTDDTSTMVRTVSGRVTYLPTNT
jgi:hypothetical protein